MAELYRTTMDAPFGALTIVASDEGVVAIRWDSEADYRDQTDEAVVDVAPGEHPVLLGATSQLDEYLAGQRTAFDVPLAPRGTEFQRQVWTVLRSIPYASTITYGEQARALGDPNKARAVGAANGRNPIPIIVPCHRVVGANGHLTGFAGGLGVKAWLLDHERAVSARV